MNKFKSFLNRSLPSKTREVMKILGLRYGNLTKYQKDTDIKKSPEQ